MSINLPDIDNVFKQPIDEHTEIPSSAVWEKINQKLDEKKIIHLKRKYTNLIRMTAILVLLLVCSVAYYYAFNKAPYEVSFTTAANSTKVDNKKSDTLKEIALGNKVESVNNDKIHTPLTTLSANETTDQFSEKSNNLSNSAKKLNGEKTFDIPAKIQDKGANPIISDLKSEGITIKDKIVSSYNDAVDTVQGTENKANFITGEFEQVVKQKKLKLISLNKIKEAHQKILLDLSTLKTTYTKINPLKFPSFIAPIIEGNIFNKSRTNINPWFKKLSATVYISPEIAFNRLDNDKMEDHGAGGGNRPPDDRHKIKKEEERATSYSIGILVNYRLKKQWSIQSGITLINKSSETAPKKVFAERADDGIIKFKNNCAFGSSFITPKKGSFINVGDSTTADETENKIAYLGIPFSIGYHIIKGKFSINPIIGTALNFLIKQAVNTGITDTTGSEKQQSKIINGLKPTYINAQFGVDFSYQLTNNFSITLMPTASMALTAVNENSTVKAYPNSFGIRAGLKFKL